MRNSLAQRARDTAYRVFIRNPRMYDEGLQLIKFVGRIDVDKTRLT
jgi:hypothetical protein